MNLVSAGRVIMCNHSIVYYTHKCKTKIGDTKRVIVMFVIIVSNVYVCVCMCISYDST